MSSVTEAFAVGDETTGEEAPAPLLEVIRRAEADVKRRLATERETAGNLVASAERRAIDLSAAAEDQGKRAGELERQAARAEIDRLAKAVLVQAQTEADSLQRCADRQIAAAIARAIEVVIGGEHEA